jgi:serine/threonine-protein kinase
VAGTREAQQLAFAGRYVRVRRIGTGGMARVFLAQDEVLDRPVAVKQLPSGAPEESLRRFRREARLGASLNHPNVVSIYDSVSEEDSLLIVMEYVEGESLAERMRHGSLPQAEALAILAQIADALDHAHANGVLHRDVKPSNVLLAEDGTAKLADLGIATAVDATAITSTGSVIGTLAYLAPERLAGEPGDAAADVYSLAAVAFEMLAGRRAHPEKTPEQLMRSVDEGRAPDLREAAPGTPPAAAAVLAEAMAADPGARPASAGELVDRLSEALGGEATAPAAVASTEPIAAAADRPPFEPPPIERRRSGHPRPLAIAALGVAGGLLLGVLLLNGGGDDGQPATTGRQAADRGDSGGKGDRAASTPTESAATPVEPGPAEPTPEPEPTPVAGSPSLLNDRGYNLIQVGDYEAAIAVLRRAVESADPSSLTYAYALFNLGNALRLAGRPEEAIPILEQRLEIPNQTATVRRELDLAYAAAGVEPPGSESGPPNGKAKGKDKDKGGKGHEGGDESE